MDINDLVIANGGYALRHQILDLGYRDAHIRAALGDGYLQRIRHGTYVVAEAHRLLSDAERLKIATFSVVDRLGDAVAASHVSAAALHGFDLWQLDTATIHVTRLDGAAGRTETGVVFHQGGAADGAIVEVAGRLATAPMRSVWESTSVCHAESAMVLASSALRIHQWSKDELLAFGAEFEQWPRMRRARVAVMRADGRLANVGEARSLFLMIRFGIEHPDLQFVLVDEHGKFIARTDFAWRRFRHLGEFDGVMKYGRLNRHTDDPGRAIVEEKWREDAARAQGYGMSRWGWRDLAPSAQASTAAMIRAGIDRSRRLYARNAVVIP